MPSDQTTRPTVESSRDRAVPPSPHGAARRLDQQRALRDRLLQPFLNQIDAAAARVFGGLHIVGRDGGVSVLLAERNGSGIFFISPPCGP